MSTKTKPYVGIICSNYDHIIHQNVLELVKNGGLAKYPAWNFMAYITYSVEGSVFVAEVWQYKALVDTIKSAHFEDLKKLVCDKYGYE